MVFDKQFFEKHQSKLLWIARHRWTRWLLGLNRLPENAKDTGFDGHIDRITPASIHWKTDKVIKKQIRRKGFRPKVAYHQEWQGMFFTRPRFAEALAYNLSPFCYFADFRRHKMVWRFSPIGVFGLFATILLPKLFGGFAFIGATDTFFPSPGTTVDGYVKNQGDDWATVHDATTGTLASDADTNTWCIYSTNNSPGNVIIWRGFFLFDTSSIADTATIDSGTINFYITAIADQLNDDCGIVQSNPASNTALATGDYDACGDAITNPTEGATRIDVTNLATSQYNAFTLNATGLGWVSKTGVSKFGWRTGDDMDNTTPTAGTDVTGVQIYYSDNTGTTYDPYLSVTYSSVYTLTCTETLSLSDTLTKQISKPLTEALSFADTLLKSLTRSFSETLNLSDTITKAKVYYKELTESISLSDVLERVNTKVLQEAVSLTDSISTLIGKVYSEAVNLSDTLIKQTGKVLSEAITFTDSIVKSIAKAAFIEAVSLTDSVIKTASRAYTETITFTDTIIKHIAKTLTESLTFTDKLKMLKNGLSTAWRKVARTLDHTWRKRPRP